MNNFFTKKVIDKQPNLCYIIPMDTKNAYDELNEQDCLDLEEWIDESQLETEKLLDKACEGVEIPSDEEIQEVMEVCLRTTRL